MADFVAHARSNYFPVKDLTAFTAAMQPFSVHIVVHTTPDTGCPGESMVALLCHEDGGWPVSVFDQHTDTLIDVDFPALIAAHLLEDHVAILMLAGAMKLRYVDASATAINSHGQQRQIDLMADILTLAAELGTHITSPVN